VKLVVLSDKHQYRAFLDTQKRGETWRVLCDNSAFSPLLDAHAFGHEKLDEFMIKDDWNAVNAWASGRAMRLVRISDKARRTGRLDLAPPIALYFSYVLAQAVKNLRFAETLLTRDIEEVLVFDQGAPRVFPEFSGNVFLNRSLAEIAALRHIPVHVVKTEAGSGRVYDDYQPPLKRAAAAAVRKAAGRVSAPLTAPRGRYDVLATGGLKHLAPVIKALKKKKIRVAVVDFEFHREQFWFAAKNGLPYITPRDPEAAAADPDFVQRHKAELVSLGEEAALRGDLMYGTHDLSGAVLEILRDSDRYLTNLSIEAARYEQLFKAHGFRAVISEEDFALRGGFLAAYCKSAGVSYYTLSHANVAVDFAVGPEERVFAQSTTFVQSEFERDMYAARGWDPSHIEVTGTPRYDRLVSLLKKRKPRGGVFRILYCAGILMPQNPDVHGYLGCHVTCYGDVQYPSLRETLRAVRGLPVEVVVKAHSTETEPELQRIVSQAGSTVNARVAPASDDFFRHVVGSDVMVLSYWSTAMIETAIAGVPTVYADFEPSIDSPSLRAFAQNGFCEIVKTPAELTRVLSRLVRTRRPRRVIQENRDRYYLGPLDGRSTERVSARILEGLRVDACPAEPVVVTGGTA